MPQQLIGEWQGEAITLYPDGRKPAHYPTRLLISVEGNRLYQQLSTAEMEFSSTATIDGSVLRFEQGKYPVQVVLLPDGASSNTPLSIPRNQPFFLEVGWLIRTDLRQRMMRSYDARGEWISLTLITEQKITV
jgi:hypothetical protein